MIAVGTSSPQTKRCICCNEVFHRRKRESAKQWAARKFCSVRCINKGRVFKSMLSRLMDSIEMIPESGCWVWMKSTDGSGFGKLGTYKGQSPVKAHRMSYEFFVGEIPEGLSLRHKCHVRPCINPNHLEPMTHQEIMKAVAREGRTNPKSLKNLVPGRKNYRGSSKKSITEARQEMLEQHPVLAATNVKKVLSRTVVVDGVKTVLG